MICESHPNARYNEHGCVSCQLGWPSDDINNILEPIEQRAEEFRMWTSFDNAAASCRDVPALVKAVKIPGEIQCPWPKDVWPSTRGEVGELMRRKLGDNDTTAISGVLMREGWELAIKTIQEFVAAILSGKEQEDENYERRNQTPNRG